PLPPTDTRAAISGRVALAALPGANDLSRVRVDLGRGEGGVPVEEGGNFAFTDLEPDVYTLTITYTGGLDAAAAGSAYRPYEARVVAKAGSSTALGEVRLELGRGAVVGTADFGSG